MGIEFPIHIVKVSSLEISWQYISNALEINIAVAKRNTKTFRLQTAPAANHVAIIY